MSERADHDQRARCGTTSWTCADPDVTRPGAGRRASPGGCRRRPGDRPPGGARRRDSRPRCSTRSAATVEKRSSQCVHRDRLGQRGAQRVDEDLRPAGRAGPPGLDSSSGQPTTTSVDLALGRPAPRPRPRPARCRAGSRSSPGARRCRARRTSPPRWSCCRRRGPWRARADHNARADRPLPGRA